MDLIKTGVADNAPYYYPIEILEGWVDYGNDSRINLPQRFPIQGEWGHPIGLETRYCKPQKDIGLKIDYISIIESRVYSIKKTLPYNQIANYGNCNDENTLLIIGIAPYGEISIWLYSRSKSFLIEWVNTTSPNYETNKDWEAKTIKKICTKYIGEDSIVYDNYTQNGLPPRDLFDNYMKQFSYRYLPLFEHWNEDEEKWQKYTEEEQETKPELDYIEEALYDGTHDKLHDGCLLTYHKAGKPKKLAIKWHIKKSEYTAYFWFEDEAVRAIFDRFYGLHPDTKTDFILHIDPEKKKYELSLFRYGLQEPRIIPEGAFQLIVFKNKFEQFRSENYDQPRGAWIW